jgi:methylamine---glutamate N-methyltransferase subunit C
VINDIHIKSELGRYRMRGFSMFKKIPHWDDLTFLPGTLTRFVIEGYREKCDTRRSSARAPSGRWCSTSRSMSPA